jgi:Autographiviridae endonuclease VII
MKTCSRCAEEKPLDEYYVVKKTGYVHAACKQCTCKSAKVWRDANPEKFRSAIRNNQLLKKYGLQAGEYEALHAKQGGACAICGDTPEGNLRVDHCHETGVVRGLLCHPCNAGIGLLRDNAALLLKAANYLKRVQ